MRIAAVACAFALAACSDSTTPGSGVGDDTASTEDGGHVVTDAGPHIYPDADPRLNWCWPSMDPVPHGTLELGRGGAAFAPMPDSLPIEYGIQGGYMVKVWTRMSGFTPGVADNDSSPENPFTRIRGTFVDIPARLQLPHGLCDPHVGYVPNNVGSYDYVQEIAVVFDLCWGSDTLVGKRIQVTAEIKDRDGNDATDTRIITLAEPLDPAYHNTPTGANCGGT